MSNTAWQQLRVSGLGVPPLPRRMHPRTRSRGASRHARAQAHAARRARGHPPRPPARLRPRLPTRMRADSQRGRMHSDSQRTHMHADNQLACGCGRARPALPAANARRGARRRQGAGRRALALAGAGAWGCVLWVRVAGQGLRAAR
jgi:hypothetical protein